MNKFITNIRDWWSVFLRVGIVPPYSKGTLYWLGFTLGWVASWLVFGGKA